MRWWPRGRARAGGSRVDPAARARESDEAAAAHFVDFIRSRKGVEAYVEPPTSVLPRTVVLVATDGEWTRRRLVDPAALQSLIDAFALPVYDARITGYPQRMRDWTSAQRKAGA